MRVPRSVNDWLAGLIYSCRRVLHVGRQPYVLYATKGTRYVMIRIHHRDRPWQCSRVTVSTDIWDRATYADREDFMVKQLQKLQRPSEGALGKPDAVDQELARKFPLLHQHLTLSTYEDGSRRETCSLTFFAHQGAFRAFLNDRDSGGAISVSADSLQGLLRLLEAELTSDAPSWFWKDQGKGRGATGKGK